MLTVRTTDTKEEIMANQSLPIFAYKTKILEVVELKNRDFLLFYNYKNHKTVVFLDELFSTLLLEES